MTIDQPLPFIVATFGPKGLPTNYNFGYEWRSVFKQKTYYSVVLAAFVKGKVKLQLIFIVILFDLIHI